MKRNGFTLIETIVAGALSLLVLAGALGLWRVGDRMNRSAASSTMLSAVRLLEEALVVDLRQLSQDPLGSEVMELTEAGVSFRVARFQGEAVSLESVRYQRVTDLHGISYLTRTETLPGGGSASRVLQVAPLASAVFRLVTDAGSGTRFLRLDFVPLESPAPGAVVDATQPPDTRTLFVALRTPGGLGIPGLASSLGVTHIPALLPLVQ